jgi:ATP-binding cassette subfamily B protein
VSSIWRIISFTRQFWRWYAVAGLFVLVTSALNLVTPLLSKAIVDEVVAQFTNGQGRWNVVLLLLGLILLGQLVQIILQAFGGWIGDILETKLETHLATRFYEHLLQLHIGYYDDEVTGKTMNKMYRGIEQITGFIQNMVNNFLPFLVTAVITIALLAFYSPLIAILLAALFPAYILISHGSTMAWKKYQDQQNELSDISLSRAYEAISGIRIVKAFAMELDELLNFRQFRQNIESINIRKTRTWHVYDFARQFVLNLITFGIYAYIIYHTFGGRFSIGEMTLLTQLVTQARFPLFAMSFILGQIQRAEAGSKDFFQVLETPALVNDRAGATQLSWQKKVNIPDVQFKDVTFGYETGKNVLHDITFSIRPGEKLALVGESGQGKSTLVNLMLRFYEPQSGSILVNGQDISRVSQQSLRAHSAVVFQESLLFSGSIRENIRFGKPDATDEQIVRAAKAANAHEFITALPDGYDSIVGERGVKLSGGQRQRVSIARAIIKDARLIILDEATSALDSQSEALVQAGLDQLMKGRTSIIIAHRLSTIASADHVLVLAGGTIAEYGRPSDLRKKSGSLYSQMVRLQQELLKDPTAAKKTELEQFDLVAE